MNVRPFSTFIGILLGSVIGGVAHAQVPMVGQHQVLELVFRSSIEVDDPFETYLLKLVVTSPGGDERVVEGFFDGTFDEPSSDGVWRARLSPDSPGVWSWRAVPGDIADPEIIGLSGRFNVVASEASGPLMADGQHFRLQDGNFVFLQGMFLDNRRRAWWDRLQFDVLREPLFTSPEMTTHVYMGENLTESERATVLERQAEEHRANKFNMYYANVGDYCGTPRCSVNPWSDEARSRMDVSHWQEYDERLMEVRDAQMIASMWFFADDSRFGTLSPDVHQRLIRYAMARHSAFSHVVFTLALEWQEGFAFDEVNRLGEFLQAHNPWRRLVSVHGLGGCSWEFADQEWPDYVQTQTDGSGDVVVNNECARRIRNEDAARPHILEEFYLGSVPRELGRQAAWGVFVGGAAGIGTGDGLAALMRFLELSGVPYQRMAPTNELALEGGSRQFVLSEPGHHYVVYALGGSSIRLDLVGRDFHAYWFNPRDPDGRLEAIGWVTAGVQEFVPPSLDRDDDWVLWVTDGTGLNRGALYVQPGMAPPFVRHFVNLD